MVAQVRRVAYPFPSGDAPFETIHLRPAGPAPFVALATEPSSPPPEVELGGSSRGASTTDLRRLSRSSHGSETDGDSGYTLLELRAHRDRQGQGSEGDLARADRGGEARDGLEHALSSAAGPEEEAAELEERCETSPEGELTAQVRDAALDSNYWWQTPTPIDASVEPDDEAGTSCAFSISSVDVTKTLVGPGSSTAYTFSLLSSGVNADVDFTNDQRDLDLSLFASPGWLELDTTELWNLGKGQLWGSLDGGSVGFVGSFAAWSDFVGGGPELDVALNDKLSGHLAIFLSASADRSVRYLGRYEGPIESLAGLHRVEIEDSRGYWNSADGGLFRSLGVGAVWSWTKEKATTYRTHLSKEDAAAWLKDERGIKHMGRNFRRALGLKLQEIPLPDPSNPLESMRVGDELTFMVEEEHQPALFAGIAFLKLGFAAARGDALEVGVKRLPGTEVEVSMRPVSLKQGGGYLGASRYVGVDATRTRVHGARQSYILDLSEVAGRGALDALLGGRAPAGAREKVVFESKRGRRPAFLREEPIAPGVRQTYLEEAQLESRGLYAGTKFFYVMPTGSRGFLGLSVSHTQGEETLAATDGVVVVTRKTEEAHVRSELLFFGNFRASTFASIREVASATSKADARRFAGLALRSEITASKVLGANEATTFVKKLNDVFGTGLKARARHGRGMSREVSVERVLEPKHFAQLARVLLREAAVAADRTGTSSDALLALASSLHETRDTTGRAKIVARFVRDHGMAGFGAIHRLLGGAPRDLTIETTTNAYSGPRERAEELALLEGSGGEGRSPVVVVDEVIGLFDQVEAARVDLEDDPFLEYCASIVRGREDPRLELGDGLSEARTLLEGLADLPARGFDAEARARMYLGLDRAKLERLARHLERTLEMRPAEPPAPLAEESARAPVGDGQGLEQVLLEVRAELSRRSPSLEARLEQEGLGWGRVRLLRP